MTIVKIFIGDDGMEWLERLNEAVDYIEVNLTEKIEYSEAAKIACCSTFHFQRMFSYIAGVPLAEYIRRRRMTLAAFDLQNGQKVLETALKYGYESPTSFNRAFQSVHGIVPSLAQKADTTLKAFPRISFKISIKGEAEMEFRIVKKDAFRIVGISRPLEKEIEKNFETVPKFWQEVSMSGILQEKLLPIMNQQPMGLLGVSACMSEDNWEYFIAVSSNVKAPDGMKEYVVPAHTWAVFPGESKSTDGIQELEKRIITEWLPTSGFEYGNAPDIEVYISPDPSNPKYEVWLPVVKKDEK